MKPKLIMLVGPAGAGKTTYCNTIYYDVRVSQDDQGKGHLDLFKLAIERKAETIVLDRMGFSKEQRNRYIIPARKAGYEIEIVVFHVPRQVCFDRMMKRHGHPTINGILSNETYDSLENETAIKTTQYQTKQNRANSALDTFFTKYERVEDSEADNVIRLGWDQPMKPEAIICDLDGTLCNIEHRLHHVQHEVRKNNRWDLFNKLIPNDSLNAWCKRILDHMCHPIQNDKELHIILCSGRVDSSRQDTKEWLDKFGIEYDRLLMRHRSDFRTDYIIKEVILDFEILPRYSVLFAIDDRTQVVQLWRRRGIVCLQCADGDF